MKQACTLIATLMLVPSLCTATTLTSLNKDDVTQLFSDKTITTIPAATLNGKIIKNAFTGYFSKDGKNYGSFQSKPEGEAQTDTGTWRVDDNGMLCYKWQHWDSSKERCVGVYKLNNGYLIVNDQNGFESLILSDQIKSGNHVNKAKP